MGRPGPAGVTLMGGASKGRSKSFSASHLPVSILVCSGCHKIYHRLGGLHNRCLFSHSSGGWEERIKVSADLASLEASLLGFQTAAFSPGPHGAFPLGTLLVSLLCVQISSSYWGTTQIGLGSSVQASFSLHYLQTLSRSEVLGIQASTSKFGALWGDTVWPRMVSL